MSAVTKEVYRFGPYVLDPMERALLRGSRPLPLTPKAFDLLCILVRNHGWLMEKEDLLARVWPDSFVQEGSLAVNISLLRKQLNAVEGDGRFIETVSKRGYRFVAEVEAVKETDRPPRSSVIAVLPFAVHGGEAVDRYLGLGLADALIMLLGQVAQVAVRPLRAVLPYADSERDPCEVGRELKVDAVVSGEVVRRGGRVRVRVQLSQVSENRVLWTDEVSCAPTKISACEDAVAKRVARALRLKLSGHEKGGPEGAADEHPEAYQCYLRGRYNWSRRTAEGLEAAVRHFGHALELSEGYAKAHAGLADAYILLNTHPPREIMPKARARAERAITLDGSLAEAHCSLAFVLDNYDWDWDGAEREFRIGLDLNPSYATGHQWHAEHLAVTGRHEEAIETIRRAQSLDPLSLSISNSVARQHYFARQYERAAEQCRHTLEMDPAFLPAHYRLGGVRLQQGRHDEAISTYRKALELSGGATVMAAELGYAYAVAGRQAEALEVLEDLRRRSAAGEHNPSYFAQIYMGLGDLDQAFDWLERARAERQPLMAYLKSEPIFDALRGDPRFGLLARRVGHP